MDKEQKIAEIRGSLEKATPGPWHMSKLAKGYLMANCGCSTKDIATFIEYNEDGSVHVEFDNWGNNAHLIANAPEWLGFLLELFDEAKKDAEFWKNEYEKGVKRVAFLGDSFERLRKERDKLIEVLRWYADAVNYEYRTSYLDQDAPIIDDNGQRARDILKEIGGTVEWQKSANDMRTTR